MPFNTKTDLNVQTIHTLRHARHLWGNLLGEEMVRRVFTPHYETNKLRQTSFSQWSNKHVTGHHTDTLMKKIVRIWPQ